MKLNKADFLNHAQTKVFEMLDQLMSGEQYEELTVKIEIGGKNTELVLDADIFSELANILECADTEEVL